MKIEILSSVMISGESVKAGSLVEVSKDHACLLISSNKARLAPEPKPEPEPEPEAPKRSRKPAPSTEVES